MSLSTTPPNRRAQIHCQTPKPRYGPAQQQFIIDVCKKINEDLAFFKNNKIVSNRMWMTAVLLSLTKRKLMFTASI